MADPYKLVVDADLAHFREGTALLQPSPADEENDRAAEMLCRLSRDITFSLGRAADYDPKYITAIAEQFEKAAELIRNTKNDDVEGFRNHIRHRAVVLREEM